MMNLFDTHFHIGDVENLEEYYANAVNSGVSYFMAVGADYDESVKSVEFSKRFENVYSSVGVHPHYADKFSNAPNVFDEFICDDVKAIGEIGLDYFYENSDRKQQRLMFESFLEYSLEKDLPTIIHCRDKDEKTTAYEECYSMLSDYSKSGGRFVVHCYTGNIDFMTRFLELGAFIGITGIVTFPRATNVRELLPHIPFERLFIETDSPYLAPVPYRGKKNTPAYVGEVAKCIASEMNIDLDRVIEQTTTNAKQFFSI